MKGRVICGFKPAPIGSNPARWPTPANIRYRIALQGLPDITRDAFRGVFRQACDTWESVCGVWFDEVERGESLTVMAMSQQAGGVLADAELPYLEGRTTPLRMRYDSKEPWAIGKPIPASRFGLYIVTLHEIGHVLGLDHGGTSLMRPNYDPNMAVGDWERQLTVQAYGPPRPRATPTNPTPPIDPAADMELFRFVQRNGRIVLLVRDGITVERMR